MATSLKSVAAPVVLCLLVAAGLGGTGCSSVGTEDPPLPDSTFARVLVDLHLTTTRADRFTQPPPAITDSVFSFHDVRRQAFDATLRYYARHPSAFSSLYDGVIDTLNALQSRRWKRSSADSPPEDVPDSVRGRVRDASSRSP